ncbi:MAG: response regulator [Flavitalea sp.]
MTKEIPPKHLVLYADDDNDDIRFVEEAFAANASNVELVSVSDGVEALNYLKDLDSMDGDPCLIILDVNMPRLNGKETLEKIRNMERFEKTPVVLFTTSSLLPDQKFAQRFNAGFVTKPLDTRQMQMITDQFIEHCSDEIQKHIRRNK